MIRFLEDVDDSLDSIASFLFSEIRKEDRRPPKLVTNRKPPPPPAHLLRRKQQSCLERKRRGNRNSDRSKDFSLGYDGESSDEDLFGGEEEGEVERVLVKKSVVPPRIPAHLLLKKKQLKSLDERTPVVTKSKGKPPPKVKVLGMVKAKYNYSAKELNESSFKKNQVLCFIRVRRDGWYVLSNGKLAPSNYFDVVKRKKQERNIHSRAGKRKDVPKKVVVDVAGALKSKYVLVRPIARYKALYDYKKRKNGEVSVKKNDIIIVYKKRRDGWFEARKGDLFGLFPGNYFESMFESKRVEMKRNRDLIHARLLEMRKRIKTRDYSKMVIVPKGESTSPLKVISSESKPEKFDTSTVNDIENEKNRKQELMKAKLRKQELMKAKLLEMKKLREKAKNRDYSHMNIVPKQEKFDTVNDIANERKRKQELLMNAKLRKQALMKTKLLEMKKLREKARNRDYSQMNIVPRGKSDGIPNVEKRKDSLIKNTPEVNKIQEDDSVRKLALERERILKLEMMKKKEVEDGKRLEIERKQKEEEEKVRNQREQKRKELMESKKRERQEEILKIQKEKKRREEEEMIRSRQEFERKKRKEEEQKAKIDRERKRKQLLEDAKKKALMDRTRRNIEHPLPKPITAKKGIGVPPKLLPTTRNELVGKSPALQSGTRKGSMGKAHKSGTRKGSIGKQKGPKKVQSVQQKRKKSISPKQVIVPREQRIVAPKQINLPETPSGKRKSKNTSDPSHDEIQNEIDQLLGGTSKTYGGKRKKKQKKVSSRGGSFKKGLINWARKWTQNYNNVEVSNLTYSFRDGLAFLAIMHKFNTSSFDYDKFSKKSVKERLAKAFSAGEKLGIPNLLDVEDITDFKKPDSIIISTYLREVIVFYKKGTWKKNDDVVSSSVKMHNSNSLNKNTSGKTLIKWPNGKKLYEGMMKNGKRDGKGISYHKDGTKNYEGFWKNDNYEGSGVYFYPTGERYTGNWVSGKKEGFGKYFYVKNEFLRYEGKWKNNQKHSKKGLLFYNPSYSIYSAGSYIEAVFERNNIKKINKCIFK